MQHRSFYVESLHLTGRPVPTRGGDLMVVRRAESGLDWELILRSPERHQIERSPYDLDMVCPDGEFSGPAILVRSDGLTHVFRGVGNLEGFHDGLFDFTDLV